jgi:hypothetical protein
MAASTGSCPYCRKPTNGISRHIQHVSPCRQQWLADMDISESVDPSATRDREVGYIDDEGWQLGGLSNDNNLTYEDAGHRRSISEYHTDIYGTHAPGDH